MLACADGVSDTLSELVGYTIIAASNVRGDFEGASTDKPVKLDNGMVFEFTEDEYAYSYRPSAVVFARVISIEELSKLLKKPATRPITPYKLVVEDEIYDVRRIK